MTSYDPLWPFPQYDQHGNRLLPPEPPKTPKQAPTSPIDDFGEALL